LRGEAGDLFADLLSILRAGFGAVIQSAFEQARALAD
jgi:hypothetical protein